MIPKLKLFPISWTADKASYHISIKHNDFIELNNNNHYQFNMGPKVFANIFRLGVIFLMTSMPARKGPNA